MKIAVKQDYFSAIANNCDSFCLGLRQGAAQQCESHNWRQNYTQADSYSTEPPQQEKFGQVCALLSDAWSNWCFLVWIWKTCTIDSLHRELCIPSV